MLFYLFDWNKFCQESKITGEPHLFIIAVYYYCSHTENKIQ